MLYPEVQKRAQEELDRVCVGRLPDFPDRASLPYIDALCVELIRWAPVAPLGELCSVLHHDLCIDLRKTHKGPHTWQ